MKRLLIASAIYLGVLAVLWTNVLWERKQGAIKAVRTAQAEQMELFEYLGIWGEGEVDWVLFIDAPCGFPETECEACWRFRWTVCEMLVKELDDG